MNENICLIEKVQPSDSPISPIILNFEYGHLPVTEPDKLECDMYLDRNNHLKRKLLVSRSGQVFIGELPPKEAPINQSLLLFRNKKTKKARAVLMQSCSLVNISREEEINKRKKLKTPPPKLLPRERSLAVNALMHSFGSKRSKRASGVGLRVNIDMTAKEEEIKETVLNIDVKLAEINTDLDGNEELIKLLPPCNRSATSSKYIYDINDVISKNERETLKPQAEFLINNGLKDIDEKTSFFMFSHHTLLNDSNDIDKVILLIYANTLYKFYNMTAADIRKKNVLTAIHPNSQLVATQVLNNFTMLSMSGRTRSSFHKDKLVCHLMVTILLFADLKINLDTLSSCLKGFGYKKLLQLARVVGLTPVQNLKTERIYVLKVPLPSLPKPRIPKKKVITSF